jgi:DNA ligase D-like protein (predicted ligase)
MAAPPALMHPSVASAPPTGPGWIFEIKWDGVRALLLREGGRVRVLGRSGQDFTATYPDVAAGVAALTGGDLALDAELVALESDGRASFHRLQRRMHDRGPSSATRRATPVTAMVFDALAVDGRDCRADPLLRRKSRVRRVLGVGDVLRYVDHVRGQGERFLAAVAARGLEGIVAKRAASRYPAARSTDWLKIKCPRTSVFTIGGYTLGRGARTSLGALHLGRRDGRALVYVGRVGSGFDDAMLARLADELSRLTVPTPPFSAGHPPAGPAHRWVRPRLTCTIRFTEWTDDGRLRHPVFLGLA